MTDARYFHEEALVRGLVGVVNRGALRPGQFIIHVPRKTTP